jgi:hypothetical protein
MKPIGQTFYINVAPAPSGPAGVFVTQIDVFFENISSTYGIEMQLRQTENGVPTPNIMPFGRKVLLPTDTYAAGSFYANGTSVPSNTAIVQASADASVPTSFIFDTPVFLQASTTYAFVLIPAGGNQDYDVWTAEINEPDTLTGVEIATNNQSGDLFLSSDDIVWTPVITEDIKYTVYVAEMTSQTGEASYITPTLDWVQHGPVTGAFQRGESLVFGNGMVNTAYLSISTSNGTFNVGDVVYQNTATANVSGLLYFSNSTVIKASNVNGAFSNNASYLLYDANTAANCVVTLVNQNTATVAFSNNITVPDSGEFTNNSMIFVQANSAAQTQILRIVSIPSNTIITVNSALSYTSNSTVIGEVYANGAVTGSYAFVMNTVWMPQNLFAGIDRVVANSTVNLKLLTNTSNGIIIGRNSGASANLVSTEDPFYNSLTTNFNYLVSPNTAIDWSMRGFKGDSTYAVDNPYITITPGTVNELRDYTRTLLSYSDTYAVLPGPRSGNSSIVVEASMESDNVFQSPVIDTLQQIATLTWNVCPPEAQLTGYYLNINAYSGHVNVGDVVTQNAYGNGIQSYGVVAARTPGTGRAEASNTSIRVIIGSGVLVSNTAMAFGNGTALFCNQATEYNESKLNGYMQASRYISKNVILAAGQDSEDMIAYVGAYRPANTNVLVFAKVLNSQDTDLFTNKAWSQLTESTSTLISSKTNTADTEELVYGFPVSTQVFASNTTTNTLSTNVYCNDTSLVVNGSFIYLVSNTVPAQFNVRRVWYVTNSTSMIIDRAPSFTGSNGAMGFIPGILSTTSAFLYDGNSDIVRYVTHSDQVFDTYIQFAIKIVPVADNQAVVPFCTDLRVLALQK